MVIGVKIELIEKLVKLLSEEPKSIKELSEELNIGWKTCERYLKSLKNIGVVIEIKTKKERLFMYNRPRRAKLLTVPKIRVGTTFELTEPPSKPYEVEDLT